MLRSLSHKAFVVLHEREFTVFIDKSGPTFSDLLRRAATSDGGVLTGGRLRSWKDLEESGRRTALALHRNGFRSGDVLAVQLPNSWEFAVLHAATARLGVLMMPLHLSYGTYETRCLIEQSEAKGLVGVARHRNRSRTGDLAQLRATCTGLEHVWADGREPDSDLGDAADLLRPDQDDDIPVGPRDPTSPLLLLASSGTTARHPKLCTHSHAGILGNAAAVIADSGYHRSDTIVSASPFSHAFGLLSLHMALTLGARVGLVEHWDADLFLRTLGECGASAAFAVPAQLRTLLSLPGLRPGVVRLRQVRTGGAGVPTDLAGSVRQIFGAELVVQWGMTEVGAGTYTRPGDGAEAVATIGRPCSGGEVRVVAPEGSPVLPATTGELQYRSRYLFDGYYRAPERTAAAFTPDGWLRTGDLARLNPDGSVTYRGRADEQINRGGLKFSALEVESLLDDRPELAQHALVAVPDARLGQRACLLVALTPGRQITLAEVVDHLLARGLARYKLPEQMVVVDNLPTTVTGKIARARLRAAPAPAGPATVEANG